MRGPGHRAAPALALLRVLWLLLAWMAAPAGATDAPAAPSTGEVTAAAAAATGSVQALPLRPGERLPLDGGLDHPAWRRAAWFDRFVEHGPRNGEPPRQRTRFAVLYDAQALYIGVQAFDARPEAIRAPRVRHDHVNRTQDFVGVFIDAQGSGQSAQFFRVSAAGATGDGLYTAADDNEDFLPDFDWDGAARRDAQGYTVVMRIPLASLRFGQQAQPAWRIMVMRRTPREQFTVDTSAPVSRDAPSFIAGLQPLVGLQLPAHAQFFSLRPGLTAHRQVDHAEGQPGEARNGLQASLDLKWRPLPELVVDGTWRPDFSQVALDVPQLAGNTRYALFHDEKRPFFLESADLLRSPTDALYTRSFTEPRGGLRATWRGQGLAGTAMVIDDHGGGLVLAPSAWGTDTLLQPPSQALAARLLAEPGPAQAGSHGLQLGAVAVWRRYAEAGVRLGDNQVIGPDFSWPLADTWRLRGQWLASRSTAQPGADGSLAEGPAREGRRLYGKLVHTSAAHEVELTLDDSSPGFRHDTGFVNQVGVRRLAARVAWGWQQLGPFNEWWLNLEGSHGRAAGSGLTVARDLLGSLWFTAPHAIEGWLAWHGGGGLSGQRTGPEQPLLREQYWKGAIEGSPGDAWPKAALSFTAGRLADVVDNRVRPGAVIKGLLLLRPRPWLELEPTLWRAWLQRGDDERAARPEAGGRAYDEGAVQLLAVLHLDARQSLRAIVQRSRYSRAASDGTVQRLGSGTESLTWAWRQSAATVLYVGASRLHEGFAGASAPGLRSSEFFVKLQFDADALWQGLGRAAVDDGAARRAARSADGTEVAAGLASGPAVSGAAAGLPRRPAGAPGLGG